jgi:type IV pilus assembly protein PilC
MQFAYEAKLRSGSASSGVIDAGTIAEARQRLRSQGLFVTHIASNTKAAAKGKKVASRLFSRVTKNDLVVFMSQLTIMCQSGVDLAEALHNLAEQSPKPAMRAILERIDKEVSGGVSFSDAVRKYPHVFDELFVAGIAAGEQSGTITDVLERMTYLIRTDLRLKSTVISMLMYPLVLAGVTFMVLNAMIFFVLPQFATVFESLEKPVPALTQFMLDTSTFIRSNWVFVIGGFFAVVGAAYGFRKAPVVRRASDYATLYMYGVRNATRCLLVGRTFRLLGTMLMSGVPLIDGIRLCKTAAKNRFFCDVFERVERDVLNGQGIKGPLCEATFMPAGAGQMVATAERSGKMGEVLKNVGEYYENEGERYLRDIIKIAEPAVIVFLGIVVAGIVMSIMLPMLDATTAH